MQYPSRFCKSFFIFFFCSDIFHPFSDWILFPHYFNINLRFYWSIECSRTVKLPSLFKKCRLISFLPFSPRLFYCFPSFRLESALVKRFVKKWDVMILRYWSDIARRRIFEWNLCEFLFCELFTKCPRIDFEESVNQKNKKKAKKKQINFEIDF